MRKHPDLCGKEVAWYLKEESAGDPPQTFFLAPGLGLIGDISNCADLIWTPGLPYIPYYSKRTLPNILLLKEESAGAPWKDKSDYMPCHSLANFNLPNNYVGKSMKTNHNKLKLYTSCQRNLMDTYLQSVLCLSKIFCGPFRTMISGTILHTIAHNNTPYNTRYYSKQ